jgi:hypothetical protein
MTDIIANLIIEEDAWVPPTKGGKAWTQPTQAGYTLHMVVAGQKMAVDTVMADDFVDAGMKFAARLGTAMRTGVKLA